MSNKFNAGDRVRFSQGHEDIDCDPSNPVHLVLGVRGQKAENDFGKYTLECTGTGSRCEDMDEILARGVELEPEFGEGDFIQHAKGSKGVVREVLHWDGDVWAVSLDDDAPTPSKVHEWTVLAKAGEWVPNNDNRPIVLRTDSLGNVEYRDETGGWRDGMQLLWFNPSNGTLSTPNWQGGAFIFDAESARWMIEVLELAFSLSRPVEVPPRHTKSPHPRKGVGRK